MKICFVIPSLSGGGAEFVAREWANWLDSRGHEVIVAITKPSDENFVNAEVSVIRLDGGTPAKHVFSLWRLIRSHHVDAVVGLLPYYNFLAILSTMLQFRRPVRVISGRNVEVPFPEVHGRKVRFMKLLSKVLYPKADGFIAISHPVAAEAGALYGLNPDKIAVIPNPATGKFFGSHDGTARVQGSKQARHSADRPETIKLVVPARISPQKRPELVIEIAKMLADMDRSVEVHFYGDGPLRQAVEELAALYKVKITVHGWIENWFMQAPSDGIVILPSRVEGFGNVFVEAACAGLPSVVPSGALGVADAVVPNVTGQLVTFDRVDDYVTAVLAAHRMVLDPEVVAQWAERFSVDSSGILLEQMLNRMRSSVIEGRA